jgi:hypothetical protein
MEVLRDISAHLRGDRPPLIPDPVTFTALLHPDEVEPFINEMTADGWSTWERLPPMNGWERVRFHRTDGKYRWLDDSFQGL